MNRGVRAEPTPPECALAAEMFDHFCAAITMKQILSLHREICNTLNLKPNRLPEFYPKLKAKLASSWKAQALFKKFDARANHKVYGKGKICSDTKVLIIGAGPCGLRAAIECQLLGSKVVVIEKRDRLSRNNVLHLWPFVIHDLRALGAKKFYGKFCAGSINHICIRQLQCILMKVSLLLGVEIFEGIAFEELLQPSVSESKEILGWRARVSPDHPVSQYEFDVLIGADGKRNTLKGFKKNEFRGKLAIGITANFINRHTEQEAAVPEISGVAYIFYQKFFKELSAATGIDLENIVYYKDDTHYFVMTAKKQSLIKKGVLIKDYPEVSRLLNKDNMDKDALMRYAQEAARFSTNGRLPTLNFALNHCGEPDVALFDFSTMYTAENACIVYERLGRRLLCQLVGDSLMEPFWPTGSGCARGFLSALDASWAVRSWGQNPPTHPLLVIAERESIYRLLPQTTTDNLQRDLGAYTLDPGTRYPNLNRAAVSPTRVTSYYQSDDPLPLDTASLTKKRRRDPEISEETLIAWVGYSEPGVRAAASPQALNDLVKRYRPDLLIDETDEQQNIYKLLHKSFGIPLLANQLSEVPDSKIRSYLTRVYYAFKGEVPHIQHESNMFSELKENQKKNSVRYSTNQNVSAYSHAAESDKSHSARRKRRLARSPQAEGKLINEPLKASGSGIRVARLAAELSNTSAEPAAKASKPKDLMRSVGKISQQDWNVKQIEKKITENRLGRPEPTSAERVPKWDREQFLGRQRRLQEGDSNDEKWEEIDVTIQKIDQKLHDTGRPLHGTKKVAKLAKKFVIEDAAASTTQPSTSQTNEQKLDASKKVWRGPPPAGKQCPVCEQRVYAAESITADGLQLHRACFRCAICNTVLRPGNYTRERYGVRLVCLRHYATHVPESVLENLSKRDFNYVNPQPAPERIYIELSDNGGREIDEDEWTDRNFFTSEASAAGELSEDSSPEEDVDGEDNEAEEDQSEPAEEAPRPPPSDIYLSDDSYGYDEYSEDGAESSNESLSNMREAREARRREVPADAPPPYTSSEMESDEDSDSSDDEKSSATEVSTDSEFAREESVAIPSPPAILVTEVPSLVVPPPQDYPLSRTKSAGGLATKRALELKRKYLLGEPSPPTVRKSESTSQLDSKLEAFRSNITEFQKLLHPATPAPQTVTPYLSYLFTNEEKKPRPDIPDIIKNLCNNVPVDLLTKGDSPLCNKDWNEPIKDEKEPDLETDSLSDDSSQSEAVPNQSVPRVEVHDEGGELIQLDSLILVSSITDDVGEKISGTATESGPTVVAIESESSESCKDATTLALTETELSDWAAESVVLDDCGIDDNADRKRNKNPRTLSGPKLIHDAKNIESISTHVCGRDSPELIVYSNAPEHFEFADEGDQDPSIGAATTPSNDGYMELVDDDYEPYSTSKDRSMNFIERVYSDTTIKSDLNDTLDKITSNLSETLEFLDSPDSKSESILLNDTEIMSKPLSTSHSSENLQPVTNVDNDSSSLSYKVMKNINDSSVSLNEAVNNAKIHLESLTLMENSPPSLSITDKINVTTSKSVIRNGNSIDDLSPPLVSEKSAYTPSITSPIHMHATRSHNLRTYSPAICRSASETFNGSNSRSMSSPSHDKNWSISPNMSNPVAENHSQVNKVQELKREREEQTEVVRRLVLERLGGAKVCRKSTRRNRVSPSSFMPPPIPPPPLYPAPPSPILGASHLNILPPPNFPAVPPRPSSHPRTSLSVQSSFSDPELTRQHRPKSFIKSISNYFNKRLGPRYKQNNQEQPSSRRALEAPPIPPPPMEARSQMPVRGLRAPPVPPPPVENSPHISVKAPPIPPPPVSNEAPPVPPPPARYSPPFENIETHAGSCTQTISESIKRNGGKRERCCHRRIGKLERRLSRQLSAAEEATTVAEILELSARRDAHEAMNTAVGRRNAASSSVGD